MFRQYDPREVIPAPDKQTDTSRAIVVRPCPVTVDNPHGLEWLIQRRSPTCSNGAGKYETPGGKCDRRMSVADEGLAEIREETGYVAKPLSGPVHVTYRRIISRSGELEALCGYGLLALVCPGAIGDGGDGEANEIGWRTARKVAELARQQKMRPDFLQLVQAVAMDVSGKPTQPDSIEQRFVHDAAGILAACKTSFTP